MSWYQSDDNAKFHPSTLVVNPPGGKSSNIFGGDDVATDNKTSVKVHHGPGGASNLSIAHNESVEQPKAVAEVPKEKPVENTINSAHTSVKTQAPPGGHSTISFGQEASNHNTFTSVKVHHPPGGASSGSLW